MCAIFITSVTRRGAGTDDAVVVHGTATGTERVRVRLRRAGEEGRRDVPVRDDGGWTAEFPVDGGDVTAVEIHARGAGESACWDEWAGEPRRPGGVGAASSDSEQDDADADAVVTVRVVAEEAASSRDSAERRPVRGAVSAPSADRGPPRRGDERPGPRGDEHDASSSDDETRPACPTVTFAPPEVEHDGGGDDPRVALEATVVRGDGDRLVARLLDTRTGEVLATESADDGRSTLRDRRRWDAGTHTVAVEVLEPDGCPRSALTFEVPRDDASSNDREASATDGDDRDDRDARSRRDERGSRERRPPPRRDDGRGRDDREVRRAGGRSRDARRDEPRRREPEREPAHRAEGAPHGVTRLGEVGPGRGAGDLRREPRGREFGSRDEAPHDRDDRDRRAGRDEDDRTAVATGACSIRFVRVEPDRWRDDDATRGDGERDGRRPVEIEATVAHARADRVTARLRDVLTGEVLCEERGDDGRVTLHARHPYRPGEHAVAVVVVEPGGCPDVSTLFDVPPVEEDGEARPAREGAGLSRADRERAEHLKRGRRHRAAEDEGDDDEDADDGDDGGSTWAGFGWMAVLAAFLAIMAIESGFLASALAFGIATAAVGVFAGVSLLACGPARWAAWTWAGIALAGVAVVLLLALTGLVSVGGVLLAAGVAAAGFAVGAAAASAYDERRFGPDDDD